MARSISPLPVFKGKDAQWLVDYLTREITPEEREFRARQREMDAELLKHLTFKGRQ